MMKLEFRSYQAPRWVAPILILAALALIPFALMLALGLAAAAIGVSTFRSLLPAADRPENPETLGARPHHSLRSGSAIDADYEIKDENEKEQHR